MCIYLCWINDQTLLLLYVPDVVVNYMILHILYMMRLVVSMRACFIIRGGVCDTHEIQGNPRELLDFCYIGHSDLHNAYYGMSCVWYTPGDSGCRISYPTCKKSKCTLTGSH